MISKKKKDTILKKFWKDNNHFADLFNTVLFHGKQVIVPEELVEKDSDVSSFLNMKNYSETLERYRDVVKKSQNGIEYAVYGVENQMSVHYAMPLRNMVYDALEYLKEYEELAHQNKEKKNLKDSAEFLSGLKKTDRLHPVITLVIYYGEESWDGPLSLCDMLQIPEHLRGLVSDYQMHLLQIVDTGKYQFQNEDVQTVFEVSRNILQRNFAEIEEKYGKRWISPLVRVCIGAITNYEQIINAAEQEGEETNMCRALEELKEEYRIKGRAEGREEERAGILGTMLKNGMTAEELAGYAGIALEEVLKIQEKMTEELQIVSA